MVKLTYFLLILCLVACGKKSNNDQDATSVGTAYQPSEAIEKELLYNTLSLAVRDNNVSLVQELLSKNSDIDLNRLNEDGDTFLIATIRHDQKEMRNILINAGADLNKANTLGETPLIIAAKLGKENTIHRLLDEKKLDDKKLDLNLQDEEGHTALLAAIKSKNSAIAIELIRTGANYKLKDHDRYDAYELAERFNLEDVMDLLRGLMQAETGMPDEKAFADMLKNGGSRTLSLLITKFPNIVQEYEHINPIVIVLENQAINSASVMITLLLQNKANINGPWDAKTPPIIKSIELRNYDFLKMFISRKADPRIKDSRGKSTLIHAVEVNNPEMVKLLKSYDLENKYATIVDGKMVKFNACDVARSVRKELKEKSDLDKNEAIKNILGCGLRWLPFI